MYDTLQLHDVFAVVAYYLAHPIEIEDYLRQCDAEATAVRSQVEATQPAGPTKEELLSRARPKGLK